MTDTDKFIFIYQETFGELKELAKEGLRFIVGKLNEDENIKDIRWKAYMLATVKHEVANTWQPISEYGKGKGYKYGKPAANGKVFYGRGYVQLTWDYNYKSFGKILGVDLYNNPDLAMNKEYAYKIMSYGMRKGAFTGVGLNKYINSEKCDYINARKIINGLDKSELIAGYAKKLETILNNSEV